MVMSQQVWVPRVPGVTSSARAWRDGDLRRLLTRDLAPLAAALQPLRAEAGDELMHQGEQAVSFLLISSGTAEVTPCRRRRRGGRQRGDAGMVVGEIALLRNGHRTATVTTPRR